MKEMNKTTKLVFNRMVELKNYIEMYEKKDYLVKMLELNAAIYFYLQREVIPNREDVLNTIKSI
jgi:hypothetical protein